MDRSQYAPPFPKESGIVQRLRARVSALPSATPRVLIACSAGKDSVALAVLAAELQRLGLINAQLAHVHHGQHAHADEAADAVDSIGLTLGMKVWHERLTPDAIERHTGVGLEEALRRERYLALARTAHYAGTDVIATAHHQQDQAETLLLRLVRGTGLDGLAGMRELTSMQIPWWREDAPPSDVRLWRPLLTEPVDVLERIAVESGLPIVEDPSNASSDYRRNAIRHQLLPVLEGVAEGATGAIARSSEVLATDHAALRAAEHIFLEQARSGEALEIAAVSELPLPLRSRVVRRWLIDAGAGDNLSADRVQAVVSLIEKNRGGSMVQLPGGVEIVVHNGHVQRKRT